MRWIYIDPTHKDEVRHRAELLDRIDAWWDAFTKATDKLDALFSAGEEWDVVGWMDQHLAAIDSRLMWEFGPAVETQGHRLVITPEVNHFLLPIVDTILNRAPKLPGWEFYAFRLPEPVEQAAANVQARSGVDISAMLGQASIGENHKIDLLFGSPDCTSVHDEETLGAGFLTAETLLGEEVLNRWIGRIDVTPLPKKGLLSRLGKRPARAVSERLLGLDRLRPTVQALIGSLTEQLPPQPCYELLDEWEWVTLEMGGRQEGEGIGRDDLIVATTGYLPMWQAAFREGYFDSSCFSRCGETFCFVKIDCHGSAAESRVAERAKWEDALNDALIGSQKGCVVGGATGYRYSYIDLALTDRGNTISRTCEVLRQNGAPSQAWILFLDTSLSQEWVGVWDDTPPPRMPAEE